MTWETGAEWETTPRKVLIIAGQEIDVSGRTAEEVKSLIIQKARELGWSRIKVLVNGEPVSPSDFASKFESAERIEVVKADIAG